MQAKTDFDIVVVGGGIVGLATAYKIALSHPAVRLAVLEKEDRLAAHQTGRNSGVIHSGLYYKPGSAKAVTCTAGRKELIEFAKTHGIPHDICGKLLVATDESELPALERLFENGRQNGVEGLERIGPERIREIEPCAAGLAALHVPSAGIIDFVKVAEKLAELIEQTGAHNRVLVSHEVTGFDKHDFYTNVLTRRGDSGGQLLAPDKRVERQELTPDGRQGALRTRCLINCAGLQCDRVARLDGITPTVRIVPFRGDYYALDGGAAGTVRHLVYPVPDPQFPFLGMHFTRLIDGSVQCGPNAVFSFKREGYGRMDVSLRDSWESLRYPGTWRLFARHWRYGLGEYVRAFSKTRRLAHLQRLIPTLTAEDLHPGKAGIRAQALDPQGRLLDDFKIEARGNSIHVLNAPSPAATAALAIGEHISQIAARQFGL